MIDDLITRGGPVMYLLLGCSVVSLAVTLERGFFWLLEARRISVKRTRELVSWCLSNDKRPKPISGGSKLEAELFESADRNNPEELAKYLRRQSDRAYERTTRHLSGLDTIVSIAPLLGILGTVLGIMHSFHALDLKHHSAPAEVIHGLAEAMLTTAAGLIIAVPSLVVFNILNSLAQRRASFLYKLGEDVSALNAKSNSSDR